MGTPYGFFCPIFFVATLLTSLIPMFSAMDSTIPFIAGGGDGWCGEWFWIKCGMAR
jgi:hypothetical protein